LGIKKAIGQPASIMVIYRYYAKSEEKHQGVETRLGPHRMRTSGQRWMLLLTYFTEPPYTWSVCTVVWEERGR